MLVERLKLFREIAIDCTASGGTVAIELKTDSPAPLTVRKTVTLASNGRQSLRVRLPWNTKGYHLQLRATPAAGTVLELFEVKVQAKPIGTPEPTGWTWFPVYVRATSDGWESARLPIRSTPEGWDAVRLPIPETSEGWREIGLAIPGFDPVPRWISFPVDEAR